MSVLPDILAPDLAVVFCGTAAGEASARRRAYYAGPGNAFWPTLFKVGLTPRRFEPGEYPEVVRHGLGLTDIVKTASGADSVLPAHLFDRARLHEVIREYAPRVLAFTGKRAAEAFLGHRVDYGLQERTVEQTRLFVLPSPSGAARRYWSEAPWRDLARLRARIVQE